MHMHRTQLKFIKLKCNGKQTQYEYDEGAEGGVYDKDNGCCTAILRIWHSVGGGGWGDIERSTKSS